MVCRNAEEFWQDNDKEARSTGKLLAAENNIKKLERELKRVSEENTVLKKANRLLPTK